MVEMTWQGFLEMLVSQFLRNSWDFKASSLRLVAAAGQKFQKNDKNQGKFPSWGNLPICGKKNIFLKIDFKLLVQAYFSLKCVFYIPIDFLSILNAFKTI